MIDGHIYRPKKWHDKEVVQFFLGLVFLVSMFSILAALVALSPLQ